MKAGIFFLLAGLMTASSANEFLHARALYYKGSDGDNDAYEQALKLFDNLRAENPSDPRIEVYAGSLTLWEASRTWALWKKNSLSKKGIELMDSAVEADPGNLEIRFVRAVTDYSLPSFFHRRDQAQHDFTSLAAQASTAVSAGKLQPRLAAASLYFHGMFLHDAGDDRSAEEAWKLAIALAPQSRAARDSAEELRKTSPLRVSK